MSLYRFQTNDVLVNTVKLYPSIHFTIYSGSAYYNNAPNVSGAFANPVRLANAGEVSLYELNIDRSASSTGRMIGDAPDTGLIYPWLVKNGTRLGFRTTSDSVWNTDDYGSLITSSYPLVSTISKEFWSSTDPRFDQNPVYVSSQNSTGSVTHILALKSTIDSYQYSNPNFIYSSSVRSFDTIDLGLLSIPTAFYGSQISKGTIDLRFYVTGTLVGRAQDTNRDGSIYETYGTNSGSLIGLALYNEGFLILTASHALSPIQDNYVGAALDNPRWIYFAQSISGTITAPSSSFTMQMSGTTTTQTLTMNATAPKGQLNQSNNPTFTQYSTAVFAASGSKTYLENNKMRIKNVVSSSYHDPTGSFEKTTYISKVGVYDENKNLIGIAKVATPVRKTVERDFTFKIKLDL
jgi:hypothetical protein